MEEVSFQGADEMVHVCECVFEIGSRISVKMIANLEYTQRIKISILESNILARL